MVLLKSRLDDKRIAAVSAPAVTDDDGIVLIGINDSDFDFDYQTELKKIWYKKLL